MKLNRIRILFEGIEESFDPQFIGDFHALFDRRRWIRIIAGLR